MFGLTNDYNYNWRVHINNLSSKLLESCFALRICSHKSSLTIRKQVSFEIIGEKLILEIIF